MLGFRGEEIFMDSQIRREASFPKIMANNRREAHNQKRKRVRVALQQKQVLPIMKFKNVFAIFGAQ